ncbi:2623_t:CDS:2, partial [Funneliformis caledonium]
DNEINAKKGVLNNQSATLSISRSQPFVSKNNEANIKTNVPNDQSVTLPIPKPPPGKCQYAHLYLKLNLDKSTYNSYISAFYNLVELYASRDVEYKNIDKNLKANIIRKNPFFSKCIGDWALHYLMRRKINIICDNAHRKNKPKNNDDKRKAKHKASVPYNNRSQDRDDSSPYLIDSDNDQGNSSVVKYIEKTIATDISHTKKKNDEANNLKSQVRLTKPTKKKSKVDISDEYTNSLP